MGVHFFKGILRDTFLRRNQRKNKMNARKKRKRTRQKMIFQILKNQ